VDADLVDWEVDWEYDESFYLIAQAILTKDGALVLKAMRGATVSALAADGRIAYIAHDESGHEYEFGSKYEVPGGGPGLAELLSEIPDEELFIEIARFERLKVSPLATVNEASMNEWLGPLFKHTANQGQSASPGSQ
jgi:hypothetical protein